ncbi:hypothetical protein TanjilG_21250 [Lupinus angustifolius]|uniref:Reticulon-like protein n=1 Tax=Lupinus angustifolius TaxID=3871 RepID=A0A4P1RMZ8_LUPAN|nr:PREDICTED: reticulon-like protein B5 [Lupinus angustifolius]XP_019439563.1 PREDICTED: reticulon-like protein B5 [Lupinus angustifolius]XP_019439564.1 PREDICTED: reticulon-like protein B5 [Lupinus angustifolius]XP_019439565.1 PREDICTED: reticulon-like protein B5 [Lupinus angustifolius]XP_019439566.1 PREDICTED: reticulon-like protein B5 [Lupinus angustifolius]XP_019439567.1 PREDICTED: reticulon-like protein B5 [Lupinus angustifolius]OIW14110.1 hypothetical protein TanjilG_21250 [Lupinus angu
MDQSSEFMDVADSDFLDGKELDDEDSGSDSEFEKYIAFSTAQNRLFGRKRPLHVVLGSGKFADIILWRDKQISASIMAGITIIWLLFYKMDYTLLSFICDSIILLLSMLFFWTHLSSFIDISQPKLSYFILPESLLANTALSMTHELNQILTTFGVLASGQDLKTFLLVTITLGSASALGNWFTAATLFYIVTMLLMIVPAVYERHEDIVDILAEKAFVELHNLYAELMKKFFGKSLHLEDNTLE